MVLTAATLATSLTGSTAAAPETPILDLLLPGDVDGARAVLQVVAASVITVTSVVFSLTVVALQITAGNYSPRVLRTFLRDFGTQLVLGTFLATFAYTYLVLQSVRSLPEGGPSDWGPETAFLPVPVFVASSLAALVFFIHHVTRSIRVDLLMVEVLDDLLDTIRKTLAGSSSEIREALEDRVPPGAAPVAAPSSGFVQAIAGQELARSLEAAGAETVFRPTIGDHVIEGSTIAWVWGSEDSDDVASDTHNAIAKAIQIGRERSLKQDVAFGLRQLVDIAVRALSPGVNDPNTAVNVILTLSVAYRELLQRDTGPASFDAGGARRVTIPFPTLDEYLHITTQQISHYGKDDQMIVLCLLRVLGELKQLAAEAHHQTIDSHIDRVLEEAENGLSLEVERLAARSAAEEARSGTNGFRHYTAAG